jgi:hypothetical protein
MPFKTSRAGCWWLTPIILATQKAGQSWFEASPGKQFIRPYLENKQTNKQKTITKRGWWSGQVEAPA